MGSDSDVPAVNLTIASATRDIGIHMDSANNALYLRTADVADQVPSRAMGVVADVSAIYHETTGWRSGFAIAGYSGSLVNTPDVDGQQWYIQCGRATGTTDGSGDLTVTFPVTFTSLVSAISQNDTSSPRFTLSHNQATTGFKIRLFNSAGTALTNTASMGASWIAIGTLA